MKLLFTRQRNFFSWLIRFITWSTYSHVDLIVDDKVFGSTALKGVHIEDINKRLETASSAEIMEIDVDNFDYEAANKFMYESLGKSYDWLGAISIGFKREWQHKEKWFCSELIAVYLKKGGLKIFDDGYYGRITPQHLYFLNYKKVSLDV